VIIPQRQLRPDVLSESHTLSYERLIALIDEFAALGGTELTITGGEPLAYDPLFLALDHAKRLRLSTNLFTSGTVAIGLDGQPVPLSVVTAELLAERIDCAVISIHGPEEFHDHLAHIAGAEHAATVALDRLAAVGIRTEIHFVATSESVQWIDQVIETAAATGASGIRIIRFVPQGRGKDVRQLNLRSGDLADLRTRLQLAVGRYRGAIKWGAAFGVSLGESKPCTAALDELVVAANGDVFACSGFSGDRGLRLGSVLEQSLLAIWTGDAADAVRKSVRLAGVARSLGVTDACAICPAQAAHQAVRARPSVRSTTTVPRSSEPGRTVSRHDSRRLAVQTGDGSSLAAQGDTRG
jgi:radical SAM protein with 4Fe4S-binding SPASM domain